MYKPADDLILPESLDTPIWRYIDIAKLVSMLDSRSLFFASVATLAEGDRWEAAFPDTFYQARIDAIEADAKAYDEERKAKHPDGYFHDTYIGSILRDEYAALTAGRRCSLERTTINCWHLNEYESDAMWKVYSAGSYMVAIRSTVDRFINSLTATTDPVVIGLVKYIDYDTNILPWSTYREPLMHKRKSFEHEREIRAIAYTDEPLSSSGILVPVDLSILMESVYIAPQSPD